MSTKTITINGRTYDAHTGMPLDDDASHEPTPHTSPKRSPLHHSKAVHNTPQKSQTLNRRIVQKIAAASTSTAAPAAKSPRITKFAPHPSGYNSTKPRVMADIGPTVHPHVARAQQKLDAQRQAAAPQQKPAQVVKQEAIQKALGNAPVKAEKATEVKTRRKLPRFMSIVSAALALLLLGGYLTYLNMPNLSVRVAAAQAGINASYPDYRPDGYSLKGPIGYNEGQVTIKFAANAGPQSYSISQTKSAWDSSAVLDNYVKNKAGDNYITYNERGLTIYTFDGNAAWVNSGILYTISGDAPLSSDQIRRIAASM